MIKNSNYFDVIILYSGSIANSASDQNYRGKMPFTLHSRQYEYNDSYQYFLQSCHKNGLKAAFSTSKDIIGSGRCRSYWTYNKKWIRNFQPAASRLIFDKFTPKSPLQLKQFELLIEGGKINTFNSRRLTNIFQNKLRTYQEFKEFAIPTVAFDHPTRRQLILAKSKLDSILLKHNFAHKFHDVYLVKDKHGAGGFNIYKLEFDKPGINGMIKQFKTDRQDNKSLSYVLQPFIDARDSFVIHKHTGLIDLRVILMHDQIIQAYIRIAHPKNYKCNEHQGGNLVYIPLNAIPDDVRAMTAKIVKSLSGKADIQQSLYALDFMRDRQNGQLYFIEGNTNPGLDWNHAKDDNARKSKDLINFIAKRLKTMSQNLAI